MTKKLSWEKISGLNKDILEKEGEEVEVFYQEKEKRKEKTKKFFRKKEEVLPAEEWFFSANQGQLVVDIYEKENFLVIKSAVAGVNPKDIDISVEPDLVVIRGERKKEEEKVKKYYYQECFWGRFSRTLVLPCPIKPEEVRANFKNGVLTVLLPKAGAESKKIEIEE